MILYLFSTLMERRKELKSKVNANKEDGTLKKLTDLEVEITRYRKLYLPEPTPLPGTLHHERERAR